MSFALLRPRAVALTAVAVTAGLLAAPHLAHAAGTCAISGTAFTDSDRNGVRGAGEAARSGDVLYLYDAAGSYVANATTSSTGDYAFSGLTCGTYTVDYAASTWWGVRETQVPTTTGGVLPRQTVTGTATASFGWRPIVTSTTPLSTYTGPQGLKVESYNDAVTAKQVYDAAIGSTVGAEAPNVTIRFADGSSSTTTSSVGATNGVYDRFSAVSHVTYLSWLDSGDGTLSHEYGHAWTLYRAYLKQQDPSLAGYLKARGLTGDSRLGSSYMWSPNEMIAEDYRQLLGSATAASLAQANYDIPPAASVPGLKDYLLGAFSTGTTTTPSPSPSPSASTSPSPSPSPSATPAPTTSPAPAPTPTASPRGKTGCRKSC